MGHYSRYFQVLNIKMSFVHLGMCTLSTCSKINRKTHDYIDILQMYMGDFSLTRRMTFE